MKRERQPREKKEFKKEGTFKKRNFIDYEKDFDYIREYVYGVLDNVCEMPENKEIGKEYLKDTINALTAIDPSRVVNWKTERYAIKYFVKKWMDAYIANHGVEGLHEKVNGMFNWLVEYIYDNTNLFINDVARSRPFDFVHVYIFPRLFLLAEVNSIDVDIRKWRVLKKFVTNMMIFGNDMNFKEYYKIEMNK